MSSSGAQLDPALTGLLVTYQVVTMAPQEGGCGVARHSAYGRATQKRNFRASCRIRGELTVLEITPNEEELDTAEPGFEKFG